MTLTKNILLVEDNPDDEELTIDALKNNNVSNPIDVVRDGQEAVDYLFGSGAYNDRHVHDTPSLVLLDLKLPKLDGLDVLQKIRSHAITQYLPVVILTSSTEDTDRLRSYANGANSYIRKPVDFQQFTEAVKQLSLYWLVLNEPPPDGEM